MLFNYRDYDSQTSAALIQKAWDLALYAYHGRSGETGKLYQQGGISPENLAKMLASDAAESAQMKQEVDSRVHESGWRNITPQMLGYPQATDSNGTWHGEAGIYKAAELEVMGKFDSDNKLTDLALSFRGTSGPLEDEPLDTLLDRIAYLNFLYPDVLAAQRGSYVENAFGELIEKIKQYAESNHLAAEDILITGHSLGGGAVNNMAELSDTAWDGFFADANYIAFASMYMKDDNPDKILNIGFDDDPVYKVIADGKLNIASLFFNFHPEKQSAVNNLYLYSDIDTLAEPGKSLGLFQSVNWLIGHDAHNYDNTLTTLLSSPLYAQMSRESAVVVSYLSDKTRDVEWVSLHSENTPRGAGQFIIGSDHDDLLRAAGDTRVDGRGGTNTFQAPGGHNSLYGSGGDDVFDTQHAASELNLATDGETFYTLSDEGDITIGHDIHWLEIKTAAGGSEKISTLTPSSALDTLSGQKLESSEGDIGATQSDSWLFARDDNHTLTGSAGRDMFVFEGGEHTVFSGGGEDIFIFHATSGKQIIVDSNDQSQFIFHGLEGMSEQELNRAVSSNGHDTIIDLGSFSVTLQNVTQFDLHQLHFI
ncbi:hypothetical protein ACLBW2_17265 [Enterobacteriaceae bacterium C23F]